MVRYASQSNTARVYDDMYDRSDATTYYGGLFSDHRAGSYSYGERYRATKAGGGRLYAKQYDEGRSYEEQRAGEQYYAEAYSDELYVEQFAGESYDECVMTKRGGKKKKRGEVARSGHYTSPQRLHISSSEKSIMIFVAVVVALIFVGLITLEAHSVSIQHEINKMDTESEQLQKEIDDLLVAIEKRSNIATVETAAVNDLKMTYPSTDQMKYLKAMEVTDTNAVAEGDAASTTSSAAETGMVGTGDGNEAGSDKDDAITAAGEDAGVAGGIESEGNGT